MFGEVGRFSQDSLDALGLMHWLVALPVTKHRLRRDAVVVHVEVQRGLVLKVTTVLPYVETSQR
jgi:hypothetical protein